MQSENKIIIFSHLRAALSVTQLGGWMTRVHRIHRNSVRVEEPVSDGSLMEFFINSIESFLLREAFEQMFVSCFFTIQSRDETTGCVPKKSGASGAFSDIYHVPAGANFPLGMQF